MSGGNSSKGRSRRATSGWEEAGGEFYQEQYPGTEQELFTADAATLHTLLPSKQARNTTTVSRVRSQNERRQSTFARTNQSRDITLSMLPDLSENLSNEERTWEEIMQIKAMPIPMSQKRDLKASLQNATKLRLQGLEQLQWRQRKAFYRLNNRVTQFITKLELWRGSLKKIEGNFGTGVVAYFLFLRWLLFLNLGIATLILLLLVLPTLVSKDIPKVCTNIYQNTTECCAEAYFNRNLTESNVFLDVIQGTGFMERTILFYGVYSNEKLIYELYIGNLVNNVMYFNMPLAYILVPIAWALGSLISIVYSSAKGFKERLVENEGQFYKYCNIVFGGWDFCIHNEKSANIKHKALLYEIRGCLEQERHNEEKHMRSIESVILLNLKRVVIHILVIAILISCAILIYVTFIFSTDRLALYEASLNRDIKYFSNHTRAEKLTLALYSDDSHIFQQLEVLVLEFLPYICIVLLNIVIPILFGYLVKFENYIPARELIITLLRTVILRLSSLIVLLTQLYINVIKPNPKACVLNEVNSCWETYAGQQFYKLIITDFVIQFITTFFINLPRSLIAKHSNSKCVKIVCEQEFYIPKHVLDIVYIQTIIWMGSFFCPFLPVIGTIFCFIMFYMKKFTCLVNCTPSPTVYRASKSKSLFMTVLLLGFIVSIAPVAFSIAEIKPSESCGPFRGLSSVWEMIYITFEGLPTLVRAPFYFLSTTTFTIPAFAVLIFSLYYYWAVSSANRHMVIVLKNQLVLEGHDKQFLLNRLSAFIRQHQKRCERAKNRTSFVDDESRQSSR